MADDWAGTAAAYEASFGRLCAGALPFLIDRSQECSPGAHALDVGTGTGSAVAALASAGFKVRGVDADPDMVAFASEHRPGLQFSVDALPSLSFNDGVFDVTVANFVVNHVLKPRTAVRELARVTTGQGLVLVTVWPSLPVSPLNQMWKHVIDASGAIPLTGHHLPPEDDFERSADGLARLLAEAGLEGVEAEEITWNFTIDAEDLWVAVEGASRMSGGPIGDKAAKAGEQ